MYFNALKTPPINLFKTPKETNLINLVNPFPNILNMSAVAMNSIIKHIAFRIFLSNSIKSINKPARGSEKLYETNPAIRKPINEKISFIKPLKKPFKNAYRSTIMIAISIMFKMKILCLQF